MSFAARMHVCPGMPQCGGRFRQAMKFSMDYGHGVMMQLPQGQEAQPGA